MFMRVVGAFLMVLVIEPVTRYQQNTPRKSEARLGPNSKPVVANQPACQDEQKPRYQKRRNTRIKMASFGGKIDSRRNQTDKQRVQPFGKERSDRCDRHQSNENREKEAVDGANCRNPQSKSIPEYRCSNTFVRQNGDMGETLVCIKVHTT